MKLIAFWAALATCASIGCAWSGTPAQPLASFKWVSRPTGEDFAYNYPSAGKNGSALLHCVVGADGGLDKCVILSVAPKGLGYDVATLKISKKYKADAKDSFGNPTAGRDFWTTINWTLESATNPTMGQVDAPPWISTPTADQISAAFPAAALGKVDHGSAKLSCYIDDNGMLVLCGANNVSPVGLGFDRAALSLASHFSVDPTWRGAIDLLLKVSVPIEFSAPLNGTPAPSAKP